MSSTVPSWNFVEKNVLFEKGDEITRVDGTTLVQKYPELYKNLTRKIDLFTNSSENNIILCCPWGEKFNHKVKVNKG